MVFVAFLSLTLVFIITFVYFVGSLYPPKMDVQQSFNLHASGIVITFVRNQDYPSPNNGFTTEETTKDIPIHSKVVCVFFYFASSLVS